MLAGLGRMKMWISVDERLPDYGDVVLIFGVDENPITAFRLLIPDSNHWQWRDYQDLTETDGYVGVTHWIPLPEPPKQETV